MKRITIFALCFLSAVVCASCGGSPSSSSEAGSEAESSAAPVHSTAEAPAGSVGVLLKKAADIYDKGKYTLECTLTGTDIEGEIKIVKAADGSSRYQLQTGALGSRGFVAAGGKIYEFDLVCGMYREADAFPELNVIGQLKKQGIAPVLSGSAGDYYTEQYVYTGETYITTMDFYFDKSDSHLVKYTTRYSVEGKDDITETRVIDRFDNEVDASRFDTAFLSGLKDLSTLSEDEKQSFCRKVCAEYGITAEQLFEAGVSADDLKTIGYDKLLELVYSFGKPAESIDDSSAGAAVPEETVSDGESSGESRTESGTDDTAPDSAETEMTQQ